MPQTEHVNCNYENGQREKQNYRLRIGKLSSSNPFPISAIRSSSILYLKLLCSRCEVFSFDFAFWFMIKGFFTFFLSVTVPLNLKPLSFIYFLFFFSISSFSYSYFFYYQFKLNAIYTLFFSFVFILRLTLSFIYWSNISFFFFLNSTDFLLRIYKEWHN